MAPIPKRKTERAPAVDKLLKPAIGIGLALLAYQFYKGLDAEILRVDVTDDLALREVFFGENAGKSYAVLCHKEDSQHISSVFQDARNDGSAPAEFRLMDCEATLESGKTIAERFKLDLNKRPTIFVSGKVGEPKQVPSKHLVTGNMLVKLLRNMLEPRAAKIETTQDLRNKCLNRDVCGLLLKGSKSVSSSVKDAMANLLAQHPKVAFASVDTSVLFVRNLEEYLPEFKAGVHRFVVFEKVSGTLDKKATDRLITSIAPLDGNVNYSNMNNLVQSVVSKQKPLNKIPALPVIKTRTKKLEQEELAKRQRRQEQQQRSNEKASDSSGGGSKFSTNDGSRDGRRAERDRRRTEHRQQNNVKERTPEELQEMERQRRARMEEEAAKWNMAPDDAPEEGERIEDEIFDFDVDEDEGDFAEQNGDEDGDDVLDLD